MRNANRATVGAAGDPWAAGNLGLETRSWRRDGPVIIDILVFRLLQGKKKVHASRPGSGGRLIIPVH